MNGHSADLAVDDLTLSSMQTSADRQSKCPAPISDRTGTPNCSRRSIETGKHSVPHRVDQPTAEALEFQLGKIIKGGQESVPARIAQRRCLLGRSHDIDKHYRREGALTCRTW